MAQARNGRKRTSVHVYMTEQEVAALSKLASRWRMSRSAAAGLIIQRALEGNGDQVFTQVPGNAVIKHQEDDSEDTS